MRRTDPRVVREVEVRQGISPHAHTDLRGPQEEMHACLAKCGEPIQRHEAAVMGELQEFQHRVQRCVQQCQDKQATTQDQGKFDKCVSECAVFYQKELASLKPQLMKKR